MIRTGLCMGVIAMSLLAGSVAHAQADPSAMAFDTLKGLVGTWRRADNPDSPLRIRFSLTAGGTVLTEEWTRDGQPHSLTVYHRDGSQLVATHYCPQGNQPRLAMVPPDGAMGIRFAFRDATDLDAAHESHVIALSLSLSNDGNLARQETYRHGDKDEPSELLLVRST